MNSWWVLALLILSSSVPALAVFFWFRIARYPFSSVRFLLILLVGATAYFPALLMQGLSPQNYLLDGRLGLIIRIFFPIAFTEELSRLLVLLVFFGIARKFDSAAHEPAFIYEPGSYSSIAYGSAVGLIAGFGFAILESAALGASYSNIILFRLFSASPIHGACGARVGSAVVLFRTNPLQGIFRFLSAVVIHGIFNSMIIMPGFAPIAAVLISLFSLVSVILTIRNGIKVNQ